MARSTRRFLVERRTDGPIEDALWGVYKKNMTMQEVECHCRFHENEWKRGLYRLTELVPTKVSFETVINLTEIE